MHKLLVTNDRIEYLEPFILFCYPSQLRLQPASRAAELGIPFRIASPAADA